MKVITKYVADDGKEFRSEKECLEHEYFVREVEKVSAKFSKGASLLNCLQEISQLSYEGQGLYLGLEMPSENTEVLAAINNEFKFYIPHWQCAETPGYKLISIEYTGYSVQLFIYGDAGSWSGPYGSRCGLGDTLRYAANTLKLFGKKPAQKDC